MKRINGLLASAVLALLPALVLAEQSAISLHAEKETPRAVFEKLFQGMSLRVRPFDPQLWERVAAQPVTIDLHNARF